MPLPKCSGPFSVGCVDVMTKATTIPKQFDPATICSTDLGSFMRLYYPCQPCSADSPAGKYKKATWIPRPNERWYSYGMARHANMGNVVSWLAHAWCRNIMMDALHNAPLIDQQSWKDLQLHSNLKECEKLPVIVFSHGLASQRAVYSVFCTQLASEGFLVAAVEHRDCSAAATFITDSDGNAIEIPYLKNTTKTDDEKEELMKLRRVQLERRTTEVICALDLLEKLDATPEDVCNCIEGDFKLTTLKDRIDTSSPLVMGHSFGGATAVNVLKKEARLKCGICLDAWFEPFTEDFFTAPNASDKPMLFIFTEYFNWEFNMKRCYQLMRNSSQDFIEVVTLKKTRHYDQCDIPGVVPSLITLWMEKKRLDLLPYTEAITVQRNIIMDYLEKYFCKKGHGAVKLLSDEYQLADEFMIGSNINVDTEE